MSKKILTPEDLRKIAERIDEEEAAEKQNAHERDQLKTEAARLKVEREKSAQSTSANDSGTSANTPATLPTQTSAKAVADSLLRYFMAALSPRSSFGQL